MLLCGESGQPASGAVEPDTSFPFGANLAPALPQADRGRLEQRHHADQDGPEQRHDADRFERMQGSIQVEWDPARELIAFFRSVRPSLPQAPFRLSRWEEIKDPEKWYRSLEQDISFGPLGVRARMGVLQSDLRWLRDFFSRYTCN
jgi:hypothetical protein